MNVALKKLKKLQFLPKVLWHPSCMHPLSIWFIFTLVSLKIVLFCFILWILVLKKKFAVLKAYCFRLN